ncbi:hypothetical protein VitviT2T_020409 [Vitis vinifera]|uniref:Annexin D4 n=1 Tax=Vitis vinifera TaxID=29760 RepID=A0ABY9D6M1_VITVI|nr:hypothetical protein VitviT2T_020409 [Vitis vinifera]
MASILGKWHLEHLESFRKRTKFFLEDERLFERWDDHHIGCLTKEFLRFKLLVALVSSYRYEGSRVNDGTARSEATTLAIAVKNVDKKNPIEDDGIVRILTTRSKLHLKAVVKYYKEIYGKNIDEDLDTLMSLKETLQCLCNPQAHFSKVLNDAFKDDADENTKEALTRVIVTRFNVDMKEIIEEFDKQYKIPLTQKIEDVALGNYKDFLVSLIRRVA